MQTIGLQLYSVRDDLGKDFAGTMERLFEFGYRSFETAGAFGKGPQWFADLLKSHGASVCSMHIGLPKKEDIAGIAETAAILGTKQCVVPWMNPALFRTSSQIQKAADDLIGARDMLAEAGLKLAYHNHDFEWRKNEDGKIPHETLQSLMPKDFIWEIDAYWVFAAGGNPFDVAKKLGAKAEFWHIKDGFGTGAMVAVGKGKIPYKENFAKLKAAKHLIVELDESRGVMMDDVRDSYKFLRGLFDQAKFDAAPIGGP
ncbi:MAG: sugar phosphate isomerase/epimerase [Chthonomonas sp.]|nr:sugar phosphate isomerase/epimerase [Chthonomonas sp.]